MGSLELFFVPTPRCFELSAYYLFFLFPILQSFVLSVSLSLFFNTSISRWKESTVRLWSLVVSALPTGSHRSQADVGSFVRGHVSKWDARALRSRKQKVFVARTGLLLTRRMREAPVNTLHASRESAVTAVSLWCRHHLMSLSVVWQHCAMSWIVCWLSRNFHRCVYLLA